MTPQELDASMNFIQDFTLTKWMLGIASGIVVSLAGALVFMYRDNKASQEKNADNLAIQNKLMMEVIGKNTEAFYRMDSTISRLTDVVDSAETSTRNLEKLILQKLK